MRGSAGGKARAKSLGPEKTKVQARSAALARWGAKAIHKGNFLDELGIDVECYVLDDAQKSAVISQIGMARVLGLSPRGNSLPNFVANKIMSEAGGGEFREKIENPLKFQWGGGGGGGPPGTIHGFDTSLLIDICNAIIKAEKQLGKRYANVARQAHLIVGASAKSGIRNLVYSLAGYNPTAEEVIAAFKAYVLEEARKYEPEFPNELYMQWHRLYNLAVPERGKPWYFKYLTVNHIYYPLAKSNGKLLQLLRALKSKGGNRYDKLFQFLNEIGTRALRMQLGRVLEMAESSPDKGAYERKITERFGGQQELELLAPPPASGITSSASLPLFEQSETAVPETA